jgi:hypothetical protein
MAIDYAPKVKWVYVDTRINYRRNSFITLTAGRTQSYTILVFLVKFETISASVQFKC